MPVRLNYATVTPGVYDAMDALDQYVNQCTLDLRLLHLIRLRASQVNGCAYCIDMHWKDSQALGEIDQRLYSLDAWQESPYYSQRERAALRWTEAVTQITNGHVSDSAHDEARRHFTEAELSDLTLAVASVNAWNRLSIAARLVPGGYKPAPVST